MRPTDQQLEEFLLNVEHTNGGWITYDTAPYLLRVFIDGKEVDKVLAVNRKEGIAEIYYDPFQLNENKDEFLTYTVYGQITLETFTDEPSPR